jgi:ATP-dependent Clp protease ATP-binding subunit ClpC
VDAIIVFHALTREQIAQIVDLELAKVSERLADHQILLQASESARALLAQLGFDPEMGARPLRRVIQNKVEDRLSDGLLSGEFRTGDRVMVDAAEGEIVLRPERPEPADTAEPALPAA